MRSRILGAGFAVVLAACGEASVRTSPSASPSAPAESTPAATPSASRTAAPTPVAQSDEWLEVASFGGDGTIETVNDVVEAPFGVLAAGVHVRTRSLNVFGELPQDGRIWLSSDGNSWEDVTPAGTFADASVDRLVVLPDGAVVAFVTFNAVDPMTGDPSQVHAEWETVDGRTWIDAEISHGSRWVHDIVQGGRGYVAAIAEDFESQLMHSDDGRTFVEVADEASGRIARGLGGGPEGFVVIAQAYESAEAPRAYASGNGTDWIESTPSDWNGLNPVDVAPLGADWLVVEAGPFDLASEATAARTWISANGLDWAESGGIQRRDYQVSDEASCRELVSSVTSTGSMVVSSSTLSYPCGEGNVQSFGASSATTDGATWRPLPFTMRETPFDLEASRGATVAAGLDLASGTLLVGESNYRATFWFRPAE